MCRSEIKFLISNSLIYSILTNKRLTFVYRVSQILFSYLKSWVNQDSISEKLDAKTLYLSYICIYACVSLYNKIVYGCVNISISFTLKLITYIYLRESIYLFLERPISSILTNLLLSAKRDRLTNLTYYN